MGGARVLTHGTQTSWRQMRVTWVLCKLQKPTGLIRKCKNY